MPARPVAGPAAAAALSAARSSAAPSVIVAAPSPDANVAVARPPQFALAPAPTLRIPVPAITAAPAAIEGVTLPAPAAEGTLFGFGRAPQVEGEFVAALRLADGRWATVRPLPEGFPNTWQRRVLLWFGLSLALIGPLALIVAWRIAEPLRTFAEAAEQLGREPTADIKLLRGPAEVGRAAAAFNIMQGRLKRYVEDRTGMVGAISHDLRTPLARMRFKLERASPSLRAAIGRDMDQMEEMITSVLSFMRDETLTAARHVVDLRSLLEVVVDDAGLDAELVPGAPVLVEIDPLGMQRVFENLVSNALKYGDHARVALRSENGEAVVEVSDDGPGLSPEDLQQVFKPFYRSAEAKTSGKAGMGLGLAVSRSTVRAHGGELILRAGAPGLIAEVRLPIAQASRMAA